MFRFLKKLLFISTDIEKHLDKDMFFSLTFWEAECLVKKDLEKAKKIRRVYRDMFDKQIDSGLIRWGD